MREHCKKCGDRLFKIVDSKILCRSGHVHAVYGGKLSDEGYKAAQAVAAGIEQSTDGEGANMGLGSLAAQTRYAKHKRHKVANRLDQSKFSAPKREAAADAKC